MSSPAAGWSAQPDVVAVQRRSVVVLFLAQAVAGLGMGAGSGMGSLMAYEVTGNEALAGLARIVSALSVAILAVPLAAAATRWGRRWALSLGWGASVVGAAALVLAARQHSLLLLLAGMFAFGAGSAASLQSRFAATDLATPARRASTLSLLLWAGTLGSVIGPNLATPGGRVGRWLGVPEIAGTYAVAGVAVAIAATVVAVLLRPDPLRLAQQRGGVSASVRRGASRGALSAVRAHPVARMALGVLVLNQIVMTGIMTLTPVHMAHAGFALPVVGVTLSAHIAGMYALSPVVGWLADRFGRRALLWSCAGLHTAALACCAVAGPRGLAWIITGLFLLGLAWSCGMVAGSALLGEGIDDAHRTATQGLSDTLMNVGAAAAAGLAGPLLGALGYAGLAGAFLVPTLAIAALLFATPRHHDAAAGREHGSLR